jgi:hypothetical protein
MHKKKNQSSKIPKTPHRHDTLTAEQSENIDNKRQKPEPKSSRVRAFIDLVRDTFRK